MIRKRNNSNSNNDNKILKSVLLVQTVLVLLSTSSIALLAFVDNGRTAKTENDVKIKEWLEKNK